MSAFQSNAAALAERLRTAVDAGLTAAALTYQRRIKEALAPGYTSGDFVTGNVVGSVAVTPPEDGPSGRTVRIGTPVLYALYWELGHHNIFTRKFERQERWVPTLLDTAPEQQAAFVQAAGAVMEGEVEFAPAESAA